MGSVLIWLVAVVTVAVIASIAIAAAGRQVTSELVSTASPIAVPNPAAQPVVTDGGPGGSPAGTVSPTSGKAGAHTAVNRAVDADGGQIQARCAGERVSLDGGYARPDRGWRAGIRTARPERVEIVFALGSERAVLVTAVCRNGAPEFSQSSIDPRDPIQAGPPPGRGKTGDDENRPDPAVTEISSSVTPSAEASAPPSPSSAPSPSPSTSAGESSPAGPSPAGSPTPSRTRPGGPASGRTGGAPDGLVTASPETAPAGATPVVVRPSASPGDPACVDSGSAGPGAVAVPGAESACGGAGSAGSGAPSVGM
ncbi:hypothetical protein KIH74_27000 [Kineosporia sp. J2-2]|uniref:Uncharacterized protein n=1 Tax=Kineosporia corallincola TaxID=2835133 RepID=A0ABS5TNE4_9ACTN|nr:hypothetical protein [Kineosporia corallincola]MBT0772621.1 hypothetical protein [Kineosporia corallincola]